MENPKIIKMNMIQAEFGVIPSIVKKENREEYIKSLVASQEEGNPNSFIEFMLKHHIANLEKTITDYNQSIENDTSTLSLFRRICILQIFDQHIRNILIMVGFVKFTSNIRTMGFQPVFQVLDSLKC